MIPVSLAHLVPHVHMHADDMIVLVLIAATVAIAAIIKKKGTKQ